MTFDKILDLDTCKIDEAYLAEWAHLRACREFGGSNPPARYLRQADDFLRDKAIVLRRQLRQRRGLPDDTTYVVVNMPVQDGVCREA